MNLLDAGLCLLPVVAEPGLSAHGLLRAAQRLFVLPEAVERRVKRPIRERGKAGYANIDADGARGLRHGLRHFPLTLDAYEPLAARLAHGDILHRAEHVAAVAVAQPAQFGQGQAVVGLIELDLLRFGISEAVGLTFLLETREVRPPGEEVGVGPLQMLSPFSSNIYP